MTDQSAAIPETQFHLIASISFDHEALLNSAVVAVANSLNAIGPIRRGRIRKRANTSLESRESD